jgi:capsular exopolysaccharide synthesis family protein
VQPEDAEKSGATKSGSFGIGTFFRGLRRYPIVASIFVLAACAAGAGVWFFLPLPKMTAFVVFKIESQPDALISQVGNAEPNYYRHQTALVKSRAVLNAALRDGNIADCELFKRDPETGARVATLDYKLGIDARGQPDFMRLTLEGDQPDELEKIIKAVAKAYMDESRDRDQAALKLRYKRLNDAQEKFQTKLAGIHQKLSREAERLGTTDPSNAILKEKYIQEALGQAERELHQIESEMRRAQVDIVNVRAKVKSLDDVPALPEDAVMAAMKGDRGYLELVAERDNLKKLIEETKKSLQPGANPPSLVEKEKQLAAANKEIDEYVKKINPELVLRLKGDGQRLAAGLDDKSKVLADLRNAILADVAKLNQRLNDTSKSQVQLENLKQEMGQAERTWERIQLQIELLGPEMEPPARVKIFEPATVVQGIEGNRRLKYSLLAFGGILIFGIGWITYLEARNRRVVCTQDASNDRGLVLIGTVPEIPYRFRNATADDRNLATVWQSMLTESVDVARTVLVHSLASEKAGHSILITSAVPGEGKTLLACHLASSFARASFKTLLIDGDMRRPSVHRVLGTPLMPGLCELLRGETAPLEAIQSTVVPGLSFVPAGNWDTRVCPTLSTSRWEILRGQLESSFDYVLIDSSPLLIVTDPLLLGRNSEGVVLSVLRNVTQIDHLEQARDRLKYLGIKVLGVVVNGLNGPGYSSYPYYRPQTPPDDVAPANSPLTPV